LPGAAERLELVALDLEKSSESDFLNAVKGCTHVLHTASPFYLNATTVDELVKPAVHGTLGVLKAAAATPSVRSVVVTSSLASVISSEDKPKDYVYKEQDWNNPDTAGIYPKSKTLAEKAAWDFHAQEKDRSWSLCTVSIS
jgi:nucleoside-diphosphate-sugar epimerase